MTAQQSSALVAQATTSNESINAFSSIQAFEDAQRMVKVFANSQLVPATFKGDIGACLIAMNMANRMGADILQVMQSLYIVHGKPSFSSAFLIACFNRCGRFSTIRYRMGGEPHTDTWSCTAVATELASGEVVEGVTVTIAMAKSEGWYNKTGSKWKTMPELMMRYRAATFLIRSVAPEIALGFQTLEEVRDVVDITSQAVDVTPTTLNEIAMQAVAEQAQPQPQQKPDPVAGEPDEAAKPAEPVEQPAEVVKATDVAEPQPEEKKDFTHKYFENHKQS